MLPVELTRSEVALGYPIGNFDGPPLPQPSRDPRPAIESVIRDALQRPPVIVAFSGGRDSSAILALATAVARRDGLPPPIPLTYRYPNVASAEEAAWQELVVRHVGLGEWERIGITDEFDWLGPYAVAAIRANGLLWPPNAATLGVAAERAAGGTVLTGIFGDEVLEPDRRDRRLRMIVGGRDRPTPRELGRVALRAAPSRLRARMFTRFGLHAEAIPPWVQPELRRTIERELAARRAREPIRWREAVHAWWQERYPHVVSASLRAVGSTFEATVSAPFGEPRFLSAVAAHAPVTGFASRTEALHLLAGDLLPAEVITRTSKASFDRAFWGQTTSSFLREWNGSGLDPSAVDVPLLHASLLAASVDPQLVPFPAAAALAVQAAWAHTQGISTPLSVTG